MFSYSNKEYLCKEKLEPIAKMYNIDNDDIFHNHINVSAGIYFLTKEDFEGRPTIKNTKKAITKVKDQTVKLANTIDSLNDFEALWLWMAQKQVKFFHDFPKLDLHETSKVEVNGNAIHLEGIENGGVRFHYMEIEDIRHALNTIQKFAQYGLDNLPSGRDGRRQQHGLYMLISNLQNFWINTLNRPFTFDEYKGEGITDPYAFCRDVSLALDPDITPTQVKSQMRRVITKS